MQVYLSLNRPDLARKERDRAQRWAEDDLLLQLIDAALGLATGRDGYADAAAFCTEQLANPSLSAPRVLAARAVARLLRGELAGARSDLEEAQAQMGGVPDAEEPPRGWPEMFCTAPRVVCGTARAPALPARWPLAVCICCSCWGCCWGC